MMTSTYGRLRAAASVHGHRTVSDRSRILLCDAESQSLHALRAMLHAAGFEVDATRTVAEALDRVALRLPAAAIIELVLPDGDGVAVCRRLREWSAMPVIVLSTVGDEEVQVRAFEAGADDYVTKPFRPRELVARLLANLRRAERGGEEPRVELDGLDIDLAARVVRRDGDEVHLTPIEFKLLSVLTQNRGRLLTHNALLQQVWGAAYTDARQTRRVHIANLRRKIEPAEGERLLLTDHGVGYRLADVHPAGARRGWPAEEAVESPAASSSTRASCRRIPARLSARLYLLTNAGPQAEPSRRAPHERAIPDGNGWPSMASSSSGGGDRLRRAAMPEPQRPRPRTETRGTHLAGEMPVHPTPHAAQPLTLQGEVK